jgi:hypothetical protein
VRWLHLPPYPDREQALWPLGIRPWHRDVIIIAWAMGGLTYEIMWGGGSPAVLTALSALLLSPALMRIDKHRTEHLCDEATEPDPVASMGRSA